MKLWNANTLDSVTLLFICYIVDERIESFGDRWMAEGQIRNIQQWEIKHSLDSTLSSNYGTSLQFLIQNNLVHESSWTSYGNPREYSLYPSIRNLLFNCPKGIQEALQAIKDKHYQELPFWSYYQNAAHRFENWCTAFASTFAHYYTMWKCFSASIIAASFSDGHCGTLASSFFERL